MSNKGEIDAEFYCEAPILDPGQEYVRAGQANDTGTLSAEEVILVNVVRILKRPSDSRQRDNVELAVLSGVESILNGLLGVCHEMRSIGSMERTREFPPAPEEGEVNLDPAGPEKDRTPQSRARRSSKRPSSP